MSRLRSALVWLVTPPLGLEATYDWFVSAMRAVIPLGIVIHALLAPLFYVCGAPVLALLNIGSTLVWLLAFALLRSRYLYVGTTLAMVEVLVHAAACVFVIGWATGFQYYLLGALSPFFLFPGKRVARWFVVGLTVFEFVLLVMVRDRPPLVALDPSLVRTMNMVNITCAFGMSLLAAIYYVRLAERAERALHLEHEKSEALLNNVMLSAIALRLKQEHATIADTFPDASVLFADIVGFTSLSESLSAGDVVTLLDEIFSRFDALVERHGVEKIKTIGDAYMAAAGVPSPRDDHAEALAALALDLRDALATVAPKLQIRIGIHSGPVVAGVIGRRRFLYDLWGDTVNTASRMESHGIPGEIQVSEKTFERLKSSYDLVERGIVEIKGKGPMKTYLLHFPIDRR